MISVFSEAFSQPRLAGRAVLGLTNLHLSKGALGRANSGLLPLQEFGFFGGRDCGISPVEYPGRIAVGQEHSDRFSDLWGHDIDYGVGRSFKEIVSACHAGDIDFLYHLVGALQTDFAEAMEQSALQHVGLRIHQATHLSQSILVEPGELLVILPEESRYEQKGGGTSTSMDRRISFSPQIPGHSVIGEAKPAWQIPGLVATSVNPSLRTALTYEDSQDIRIEMANAMPRYCRIDELQKEGDHWQWGASQLCSDGDFSNMPGGRAVFFVLETADGMEYNC